MPLEPMELPATDPTSIYRYRDGLYAVDMLTAALCELNFFSWLAAHPSEPAAICSALGLQARPVDVMLTLFTAMGHLENRGGTFFLTDQAREHLVDSSPWFIGPYFASVKERPVCQDILAVLRTGKPSNWASMKNEKEWAKGMEGEAFARKFAAAMDCRGAYLGPALAKKLDCAGRRRFLDIAGGSGNYACALAAEHPHLRGSVLERPPVDEIARRNLAARGVAERVDVMVGDMFAQNLPKGFDLHLYSNVLHDWNVDRVKLLLRKSAGALEPGGMIVIHDAHINAAKTGPLPVAAYSALLMTITEGKCYSEQEMAEYLHEAGFTGVKHTATAADRSFISARLAA
jgi:predicted O-methyltransferase YrrM